MGWSPIYRVWRLEAFRAIQVKRLILIINGLNKRLVPGVKTSVDESEEVKSVRLKKRQAGQVHKIRGAIGCRLVRVHDPWEIVYVQTETGFGC